MTQPFARDGDSIRVTLRHGEAELLAGIVPLLGSVGDEDAAAVRLNPPAYRGDERAAAEYRRLMATELETARDDDRRAFAATVRSRSITMADAEAWLRVIGDTRLALAARRGVLDPDDDWEDRARSDPDLALVAYLGYLQACLVDVVDPG